MDRFLLVVPDVDIYSLSLAFLLAIPQGKSMPSFIAMNSRTLTIKEKINFHQIFQHCNEKRSIHKVINKPNLNVPHQMKVAEVWRPSIDVSQPQGLQNQRSQKPAMYNM